MQPSLNIWTVLLLFAATQGLFLGVVLLTQGRGNRRANRILAILILLFSIRLIETVAYWTKYLLQMPHLWLVSASFPFLFGVLLHYYAAFLVAPDRQQRQTDWLHLLPFAIHAAWLVSFYRLSGEIKLRILQRFIDLENPKIALVYLLIVMAQIFHMLLYTHLTLRLLKQHPPHTKNGVVSTVRINLSWLRTLTAGFGSFVLLTLLYVIWMQAGLPYSRGVDALVLIAMAGMIYGIGYQTLRQPEIFAGTLARKNGPKYEKPALTAARADAYLARLVKAMTTEKLFVNSGLGLQDLAARLNVSPHHLLQILNDRLGQNFFDFVNQHRIEEAKRLLAAPEKQHLTILSLALEVGFNNKASFNTSFKKYTGTTPSQYRSAKVKADRS